MQANCLECGSAIIESRKNRQRKYCDNKCQVLHQKATFIQRWKSGEEKGYGGKNHEVSGHIRQYLKDKRGNCCWKCGWCEVHPLTGLVPVQLNHIDGDATNCVEENLEFLCPNCHSLTPNFMALNKGKGKRNLGD